MAFQIQNSGSHLHAHAHTHTHTHTHFNGVSIRLKHIFYVVKMLLNEIKIQNSLTNVLDFYSRKRENMAVIHHMK